MSPATAAQILIVDDLLSNVETLVAVLGDDYELSIATSGAQALDLLATGLRPQLILLDTMMPGMDGYEVCAVLKLQLATRDIPVIFVTAKTDAASESRALAAGAVDFVQKPINKDVVRARVALHLEMKRHREQLEDLVHARTLELARARDEAESGSRAKTAFLNTVGHELRTPMNHIIGSAFLLNRHLPEGRSRDWVQHIQTSSTHLLAMIDDVLDYAHSEASTLELATIDFDLHALLARTLVRVRDAAAKKGLKVSCTVEPTVPVRLKGDPVRISQVLEHLLGNALKFSDAGLIDVRVYQTGMLGDIVSLRCEVQDQGIGIAQEHQSELFQSFRQADESLSRKYGGTGLGLAFCKRLVALMGGQIGVTSAPAQGSTFWFTLNLPLASSPVVEPTRPHATDWTTIRALFISLDELLAHGNAAARSLWLESDGLFQSVLRDGKDELHQAIQSSDFPTASRLLRAAVAANPDLQIWTRR